MLVATLLEATWRCLSGSTVIRSTRLDARRRLEHGEAGPGVVFIKPQVTAAPRQHCLFFERGQIGGWYIPQNQLENHD